MVTAVLFGLFAVLLLIGKHLMLQSCSSVQQYSQPCPSPLEGRVIDLVVPSCLVNVKTYLFPLTSYSNVFIVLPLHK